MGLKGTVGPVSLGGEKSGFKFSAIINNVWRSEGNQESSWRGWTIEKLEEILAQGGANVENEALWSGKFRSRFEMSITFSGPRFGHGTKSEIKNKLEELIMISPLIFCLH